ncbi:glucose-6-phosphate dehydrogenase [Spirochaeta cellobiosiphila]|uniref:glucose-6-phosphate dehydrogenase n=1 Tax=Spirochaeta cellobiosiphila TaxID=504483 RepID=UPI0003FBC2E3|nr:glucose-6-phosphate dehydrogenase [Spirochaeta cellobiosiphila]
MNNNPLLSGLEFTKETGSFSLVIFGVTGDLTRRKLIPALFNLFIEGRINQFKIIGFARRTWTDETFRDEGRKMLSGGKFDSISSDKKEAFLSRLEYISSNFEDPKGYKELLNKINGFGGTLYYLSTPPTSYEAIIENLGKNGLANPDTAYARIIIEKPFGRDLATAKKLNTHLSTYFEEKQIYRIDHYLGKETVQNLLIFRFGNSIFEPLWNNKHIDHIQITVSEGIGVGTRANYFEKSGILRDMVQNHIFQLLTLIAMEPPADLNPDSIRDEKVKVLRSLKPITSKEVGQYTRRAQYNRGIVEGEEVKSYKEEEGVDPKSLTETYVALKVFIENWRWAGVPIYIRTGKRLSRKLTEISIHFKNPPHQIFPNSHPSLNANTLILHIQPEEGITFNINAKIPGLSTSMRRVNMDFAYGNAFGEQTPEAYQRLLLDAITGDPSLYTRRDEIETSWSYITRIINGWINENPPMYSYRSGSAGPEESNDLMEKGKWRRL